MELDPNNDQNQDNDQDQGNDQNQDNRDPAGAADEEEDSSDSENNELVADDTDEEAALQVLHSDSSEGDEDREDAGVFMARLRRWIGWGDRPDSDEQQEDEEMNEQQRQVIYDKSLPARHDYLGTDLEDVRGRVILDDGAVVSLPLLALPGVVLMPGQTLPLHLFPHHTVAMVRHVMDTDKTLGIVTSLMNRTSGEVESCLGTTAEIVAIKEEEDEGAGITNVRLKAVGRQRFYVHETRRQTDGVLRAKVRILPECYLPHPLEGAHLRTRLRLSLPESAHTAPHTAQTTHSVHSAQGGAGTAAGAVGGDLAAILKDALKTHARRRPTRHDKLNSAYLTWWPPWVYRQYDLAHLMTRVRSELAGWNMCETAENNSGGVGDNAHETRGHRNTWAADTWRVDTQESSMETNRQNAEAGGAQRDEQGDSGRDNGARGASAWDTETLRETAADSGTRGASAMNTGTQRASAPDTGTRGASGLDVVEEAVRFSHWVAAMLPLDDRMKLELLRIDHAAQRLRYLLSVLQKYSVLCCAHCELYIANKQDVFSLTLQGPMAAYVNPGGYVHETLTIYRVQGLNLVGRPSTENSWFPGYAWTIAQCRSCHHHMGWKFTAAKRGLKPEKFWGLTRSSLQPALRKGEEGEGGAGEGEEGWQPVM